VIFAIASTPPKEKPNHFSAGKRPPTGRTATVVIGIRHEMPDRYPDNDEARPAVQSQSFLRADGNILTLIAPKGTV
jgi:hypothetical protein